MAATLGQITQAVRNWLSKRVYIQRWDADKPLQNNVRAQSDNRVYPANTAFTLPPEKISTKLSYIGVETTTQVNVTFCFRFKHVAHPLKESLPFNSLLTLYNQVGTLITADRRFVQKDILEIRLNDVEEPIRIAIDDVAQQGQKDWLVYLDFSFMVRFHSSFSHDYNRSEEEDLEIPGVVPSIPGGGSIPIDTIEMKVNVVDMSNDNESTAVEIDIDVQD